MEKDKEDLDREEDTSKSLGKELSDFKTHNI